MATMQNTIPKDTWFFTSVAGTYNFLYPVEHPIQAQNDITVEALSWQTQRGLSPFSTVLGVVWCDKSSVKSV